MVEVLCYLLACLFLWSTCAVVVQSGGGVGLAGTIWVIWPGVVEGWPGRLMVLVERLLNDGQMGERLLMG